jgi:hypothetical protein
MQKKIPSVPSLVESEEAVHEFAEHVAVVSVPALQDDVPDTVYPELHVGWHVEPLATELVQSPAPPFVGAVDASHGFAAHVAAVNVPKEHELVRDTVYPESHVGWQVDPLAMEPVQSPTPPFVGAADASHGDPDTSMGVLMACHPIVPSPSWPWLLSPQHLIATPVSTAQEWYPPRATLVAVVIPETLTGELRWVV